MLDADIKALVEYSSDCKFIKFPFFLLKIAQPWIRFKYEQTYYQKSLQERDKILSMKFARIVTRLLSLSYNFDTYISANFDYHEDFAFKSLDEKKFFAISREHYITQSSYKKAYKRYKNCDYQFQGDKVFVFGEITRKLLLESGVCTKDQIIVSGAPRMDFLKKSRKTEKRIIIYSFRYGNYRGNNLFDSLLTSIIELCKKRGDLKLTVKHKNKYHCEEYLGKPEFSIAEHIYDDPDFKFLMKSRVLISYNSNSIIEGLAAGLNVIVPWYDKFVQSEETSLVHPDRDISASLFFPESQERLLEIIEENIQKHSSQEDRHIQIVNKYFKFNEEETSAEQILRVL